VAWLAKGVELPTIPNEQQRAWQGLEIQKTKGVGGGT
jgi:hypothetical protein